ncbi:hypothetical protein DL762_004005 [Monosporascus cannonballus]|uniref:Uncharacterized protein n=1 Tax=Monosporascus cannonballus TaxID=155416 RepID=A0ABY0H8V7_9PEZI|nr:hypothetical protein DL762_004005 [Monosporascus cannonballus]
MPDEEMEMMTDLGQPGFAEDIDIDLDLTQPDDEDMELADFDQAQDMQNFNSDARDELMAEGDEESFGMIDVEDVSHNKAATAANDIEIDIGGPDDGFAPQLADYDGAPNEADELHYVEEMGAEDQNLESGDWFQASTDLVAGSVEDPQVDSLGNIDAGSITNAAWGPENAALLDEKNPQDPTAPDTENNNTSVHEEAHVQGVAALENVEHGDSGIQHEPRHDAGFAEPSRDSLDGEHDQEHDRAPGPVGKAGGEADDSEPAIQAQLGDGDAGADADSFADDSLRKEQPAEHNRPVPDSKAVETQLDGDSNEEHTNNEAHENEEKVEDKASSNPGSQNELEDPDRRAADPQEGSALEGEQEPRARDAPVEHLASITMRHEIYVSYGQTDYRLFAKSEDDDPNQYFLKNASALDLSLAEFLSSLRDVVSEEVSPLDELVMHVDGLGVEFAESTTSDFLKRYSFGDILKLYGDLVRNDEAETQPDLYCYLMVRPNCSQRLMALIDSANSGRGLSEIAVYRDTTPFDEALASEPGSPAFSTSADDEAAEETYEHAEARHEVHDESHDEAHDEAYEEAHEEAHNEVQDEAHAKTHAEEDGVGEADPDDSHDLNEAAGLVNEPEPNSVAGEEVTTLDTARTAENSVEHPAETDGEAVGQNPEDELIDFSDGELDLSPSKQGKFPHSRSSPFSFICTQDSECQCDACFQVELERLDASWRLNGAASAGTAASSAETNPVKDARLLPRDAWAKNRSAPSHSGYSPGLLPQPLSSDDRKLDTDSHRHQDRPSKTSPTAEAEVVNIEVDPARQTESGTEVASSHDHPAASSNQPTDAPDSGDTSATNTLNGDDQDEIDYSDDENETGNASGTANTEARAPATLKAALDEEITWESENEEIKNETAMSTSKGTVQVSPPHGKRMWSETGDVDGEGEQNDVKRLRS